jgi:DNA transformation protein
MGSRCSASFLSDAIFLFSPLGDVTVRQMFGGHGVYLNEMHFSILAWNEIYLKADAINEQVFIQNRCRRFSYMRKTQLSHLNYYAAPDEVFEDRAALVRWSRLALDAALRARKNTFNQCFKNITE